MVFGMDDEDPTLLDLSNVQAHKQRSSKDLNAISEMSSIPLAACNSVAIRKQTLE